MALGWTVVALVLAAAVIGLFCLRDDQPHEDRAPATTARAVRADRALARDPRLVKQRLRQLALALAKQTEQLVSISGTVRSSGTGEPIADAQVLLAGIANKWKSRTDGQGNYTVRVPMGIYRAYAQAEGYVAAGSAGFQRHPRPPSADDAGAPLPELAPLLDAGADRSGVDLELRGGGTILGQVRDPFGDPVAGAVIAGRLFGFEGKHTRLVSGGDTAIAGNDGSFRLQVPAGSVELVASHRDFAGLDDASNRIIHLSPGDEREIELTLAEGCVIEGQVVDRQGMSAGDGAIEIGTGMSFPHEFKPAGTFTDGRFRYTYTGGGQVRLKAWPWKSTHSKPQDFDCSDGARHDDVTFVIDPIAPDVEGVVVAEDGEPIPGAYLDLLPIEHGGLAQQERADDAGEFAFFSHPPGRYVLSAHVPHEGVAATEVTVPVRGVRLELSGTGSITGEARGLDTGSFVFVIDECTAGTDGHRWPVVGQRTTAQARRLVRVEDGRFRIDDLPVCDLRAVARTVDREHYVTVQVRADREARLDLDLGPPVVKTVHGTVRDADGDPAPHADVTRIPAEPFNVQTGLRRQLPQRAETDGAGRYEIQVLAGETLRFFSPRGYARASVGASKAARERIDVTLSPLPAPRPESFGPLLGEYF
jgi:hypothetical protein